MNKPVKTFPRLQRISISLSLISIQAVWQHSAAAHPVVFAGGTALMGHHNGEHAELEVVHSPNSWSGFGLGVGSHDEQKFALAKASALVWRGNFPDYQSNLYVSLGAGRRWDDQHERRDPSPHAEELRDHVDTHESGASQNLLTWDFEWDGEDREKYSVLKFGQSFDGSKLNHNRALVRMGFAPYKAQADELAFWGILEVSGTQKSGQKDWRNDVTPLVRMYYKNALIEVGSSLGGRFAFNYMFHFFN